MRGESIMKNFLKKALLVLLTILMVGEMSITPMNATAASKNNKVTAREYIKLMVNATKLKVNPKDKDPYVTAALNGGLIKKGELKSYTASIKKEDAAVIANRADELIHGTKYDKKELCKQIKNKKRLTNLNSVTKSKQDSVIKVYAKGIMIGASNGLYTHSRKFNGKEALTMSEAKILASRVKTPSKRRKLSPDGQLTRTTNLPKGNKNQKRTEVTQELPYQVKGYPTYKDYSYILASFPNAFYEKLFRYQGKRYGKKPVALVDYASPVRLAKMKFNGYKMNDVLNANLDSWAKKIQTNLNTRLNVDYRAIDGKWINTLRNTYYVYNDADMDKRKTKDIKEYGTKVKKNKVIGKGTVSVEPSTLYYDKGFYMRAYIKFKVVNATHMNVDEADLIYGENIYIPNLKKNQWVTTYVDIRLGSANGYSSRKDFAVFGDSIVKE